MSLNPAFHLGMVILFLFTRFYFRETPETIDYQKREGYEAVAWGLVIMHMVCGVL